MVDGAAGWPLMVAGEDVAWWSAGGCLLPVRRWIQMDSMMSSPRFAPLLVETMRSWLMVPILARSSGLMASELFQKSKPLTLP